ncbi:predicted protein [Chaetomium globosum CBS 148.51]|uniref:F-box domain-containing protein n=1 Tax=Chaetomium globosum (strain ATCC 6205 / CBS 148.51 / DSM 1962 / NBRC 6347 / NRRL 1970) TaxID=306901 RepID=Q2GV73_CHAGB|nr:uncharacterized protein CHGG_08131 [Chaetomium globosum CBS 148.51]EAQ86878.1 predicted protein [Chaetomium globosum CBS 148.51]
MRCQGGPGFYEQWWFCAMHQADESRSTHENREQQQEQPPPSSPPNPTCGLELLPTEILVAILSAARSTADLHALIQASPRFYQVFIPTKKEVLLNIVATDLGAALRDALAVVLIAPPKLDPQKPTYLEECEHVIRRYEALPHSTDHGGLTSATRGLPIDTIVALTHLNRTVQSLIDEFASTRFPELHKIHPAATTSPPTTTERRRLAAALLRHQVLARIEHGRNRPRVEPNQHRAPETAAMHRFLGLFRPWEAEQLTEVHTFLCESADLAFPPPAPGIRGAHRRHQQPWERQRDAALCDLRLMRCALSARHAGVATDDPAPAAGLRMAFVERFPSLRAGPLPDKGYVLCYVAREDWALRDELYRREDALAPLGFGENGDGDDDAAPPFAWVDAHGGLDCQRWGGYLCRDVLREGQEDVTSLQRTWVRTSLDRWRWLGWVFWDRARVELLKARMPVYETGWLRAGPPSDGEILEAYRRARSRPSRRGSTVQGGEAVR